MKRKCFNAELPNELGALVDRDAEPIRGVLFRRGGFILSRTQNAHLRARPPFSSLFRSLSYPQNRITDRSEITRRGHCGRTHGAVVRPDEHAVGFREDADPFDPIGSCGGMRVHTVPFG